MLVPALALPPAADPPAGQPRLVFVAVVDGPPFPAPRASAPSSLLALARSSSTPFPSFSSSRHLDSPPCASCVACAFSSEMDAETEWPEPTLVLGKAPGTPRRIIEAERMELPELAERG